MTDPVLIFLNFAYRLIETVEAMNYRELHITFISDMTCMHPALNKTTVRRITLRQLEYEAKRFYMIKFFMFFFLHLKLSKSQFNRHTYYVTIFTFKVLSLIL